MEQFLGSKLMEKYSEQITSLMLEDGGELFESLLKTAKENGARSYPILIKEDGQLLSTGFDPTKVVTALKKELG